MIESILREYRSTLKGAYDGYMNHALRVNAITQHLCKGANKAEIEIASAFHDLGVWIYDTMDYLDPSVTCALNYVEKEGIKVDKNLIADLIFYHHQLRPYKKNETVESFRKADLIDLSNGLVKCGFPKEAYQKLIVSYPRHGFTKYIAKKALMHAVTHPMHPLPMIRS